MKLILALVISAFSLTALASDRSLTSTLSKIEFDKNIKCELVKNSFGFCLGGSALLQTCRYTSTYRCFGNEDLTVKLKIKSFYNHATNARESVVTKTKIQ